MGVRAYVRSPVALAWTLVGVVGVGSVVAVTLRLSALAGRSGVVASATAIGGLGGFLFTALFVVLAVAAAALVWLPCSLGIAYAVGGRVRGRQVSLGGSIDRLRTRREPLYRWVKTRIAIEPIRERIFTENDVSPAEIAVGCGAFVVPALALDSRTLQTAVGRANQAVPKSGRERVLLAGIAATGGLVGGAIAAGLFGDPQVVSTGTLVLGAAVVGGVITSAVDTAWRATVYADQNLEDGFG